MKIDLDFFVVLVPKTLNAREEIKDNEDYQKGLNKQNETEPYLSCLDTNSNEL